MSSALTFPKYSHKQTSSTSELPAGTGPTLHSEVTGRWGSQWWGDSQLTAGSPILDMKASE